MKDNVLKFAICISIVLHLVSLAIIGRTSAVKPIEVDNLKLVRVDLVKTPDDISVDKNTSEAPKPEPKPETTTYNPPPAPFVPPVQNMDTEKRVKPLAQVNPKYYRPPVPGAVKPTRMASFRPAGDPGGELNLGSSSSHGSLSVSQGQTSVGFVPSPTPGRGEGSGTGVGRAAREDPDPNASSGPGTTPAPQPAYIPPPQPRTVEVRVCSVSHLRPGPYCQNTETREYTEGSAPTETCDRCKAPEPKHESRLAESKPEELIRDVDVRVPGIVKEAGVRAIVKVTYTVNEDGSVSDVEVIKSSGNPLLDRAVTEAWSKLKYSPAMQDGVPRSIKKRRTFNYNGE